VQDDEKPVIPPVAPPASADKPKPPPVDDRIDIRRFFETKLRVAKILSAERVENADKLLKLQVSLGDEERQLVAGLAEHYTLESLIGKTVVVVANLKPARIRGVESQGMLLAADVDGRPVVATFDEEVAPGTQVR